MSVASGYPRAHEDAAAQLRIAAVVAPAYARPTQLNAASLCDVKDLICNRTLLGNFLNFGRSRLTIGKVCSQLLQTR